MVDKILITWSGGKDSALTLYEIQNHFNFEITALLTSMTIGYDRISMHGVQRVLLEQQAESLDITLDTIYLNKKSSNEEYEQKMEEKLLNYKSIGILDVAFGDIFLEDVRRYREDNLAKVGMNGIFPLWKRKTSKLARKFIDLGFKAVVTCVDSEQLDRSFVGRTINEQFLNDLPEGVDPCGENGEYHSFVFDGPNFNQPITYELGEVVLREKRFYYIDLISDGSKD
jgi:uncharacterized protein (TIGR00290 family)